MLVDLTACDSEPIHTPGFIQPFGVLLAFDVNTLRLRHASLNIHDLLGPKVPDPLGLTAAELLGSDAETALRDALAKGGRIDYCPIPVSVSSTNARPCHGVARCQGDIVFVELEPAEDNATSSIEVLAAIRAWVGQQAATVNISELCTCVARNVRLLTSYDRVMVYRFAADWNGEVVADERHADLETFLGLHYPASDIPSQVRSLLSTNRIRVISDASRAPIPIAPVRDSLTGLPLDLSCCLLRGVSPVHLEYLHNMGVKASLTASLIVRGQLWGLIACHHLTPKHLGPAKRDGCDLIARLASDQLACVADLEDRHRQEGLANALGRTGVRIGGSSPPIAGLTKDAGDLLALVRATGAVIWRSGRGALIGQTPPGEALPELIDWIKGVASPLIVTDRLAQLYPAAKQFAAVASGLMAVEVSRDTDEYILWFRTEVLQDVNWGGDPRGKASPDGRLTPRRSFAVWRETVQARSLPWRSAEVENAKRVREQVLVAASRSAARLEALLPICAWCKSVRNEPGYWRAVEEFIHDVVEVRFTHGVCPKCLDKQLAELARNRACSQSRT
jgi:two-component system, chemotaxis family, sensor kinase Cph1